MAATTKAIGLGLLVLLVALTVPMMINATDGEQSYRVELVEGEEQQVTNEINVTSENIRPPQPENATITVEDTETLERDTQAIRNGSSAVYQHDGGNVTVTLTDVSEGPETIRATVDVPRTYGWSGPAQRFGANMGFVLAVVGFIVIAGAIGAMIQAW